MIERAEKFGLIYCKAEGYRVYGLGEWGVTGTGLRLTPVYHLMDSKVWTGTGYKKRILF